MEQHTVTPSGPAAAAPAPLSQAAFWALVSLSLWLVVLPLTLGKPGLPPLLEAHETAHYLAALSLAHDRDLRCERSDVERLFPEFPYGDPAVRLMPGTGAFDASWVYAAAQAPWAALLGANGMVSAQMLLLVAASWLAAALLRRIGDELPAVLLAVGFVVVSPWFRYGFRLQGEVLAAFATLLALAAALRDEPPFPWLHRLWSKRWRPLLAGVLLAVAVHERPHLLLLALPSLVALAPLGSRRRFAVALAVALAVLAGVGYGLTGRLLGHLDPAAAPVAVGNPHVFAPPPPEAVSHAYRLPPAPHLRTLARNAFYFLFGRHTGMVLYFPFAVLAVGLFLAHVRRSDRAGWTLGAAVLAAALATLVWLPHDWQGGDDFLANRHFLPLYPAFLFLVTRVAPTWIPVLGFAAAGLFSGMMLLTPFGAPMPHHDDQGHARAAALRPFPVELHLLDRLPDLVEVDDPVSPMRLRAREDVALAVDGDLWLRGAVPIELWLETAAPPAGELAFWLHDYQPGNRVRLELGGGERAEVRFPDELPPTGVSEVVTLPSAGWRELVDRDGGRRFVTRMVVEADRGAVPRWRDPAGSEAYIGVELAYLGPAADLADDVDAAALEPVAVPLAVAPGAPLTVWSEIRNRIPTALPAEGPVRVYLTHRWRTRDSDWLVGPKQRTPLPEPLAGGATVRVAQTTFAPELPGCYLLVIELERAHLPSFAMRGNPTRHALQVRVVWPRDARHRD